MAYCSVCHADLHGIDNADNETSQCPFCGADLADMDAVAAESTPSASVGNDPDEGRTIGSGPLVDQPPPKSHVELVESGPERLVLYIPPGGSSSSGIGCFAVMWNAFMCVFTPPCLFAIAQGNGPPLLFIIPFLLVFWGIGIGFLHVWLRMKWTRTYLLVEPHRVVMQTERFGRKRMDEAPLGEFAHARLAESYRMNDVPVHRVEVLAEGRKMHFGTQLAEPEKIWIVEQINRFLRRDEAALLGPWPASCAACGAELDSALLPRDELAALCPHCGVTVQRAQSRPKLAIPRVGPTDLPPDSPVHVVEDDIERLSFWLPLLPAGNVRQGVIAISLIIALLAGVMSALILHSQLHRDHGKPGDLIGVVIASVMMLSSLALAMGGLLIGKARLSVDLDSQWLRVRYHLGPFGVTRKLATRTIDAVQLRTSADFQKESVAKGRAPARPHRGEDFVVATVAMGPTYLMLTTLHDRAMAATVAGLVRTRLERLGVELVA